MYIPKEKASDEEPRSGGGPIDTRAWACCQERYSHFRSLLS